MPAEKIYKVFVSSTYEDLREERSAVQKALLQMNCLPVGMELFPAADDDTWDFIKTQIEDSDYYVVVVAGRYGSLASDGVSFTEKEWEYARSQNIPSIGFVHGNPSSIAVGKTEPSEDRKQKLADFTAKVRQRLTRSYTSPDDLALQVSTSFYQLIHDKPRDGYIRYTDAVEYKRYAELLEDNNQLKEQLKRADLDIRPFPEIDRVLSLNVIVSPKTGQEHTEAIDCTIKAIFLAFADALLDNNDQMVLISRATRQLIGRSPHPESTYKLTEDSLLTVRKLLVLYGLIELAYADFSSYSGTHRTTVTQTKMIWKLTDYGRRQLLLLGA